MAPATRSRGDDDRHQDRGQCAEDDLQNAVERTGERQPADRRHQHHHDQRDAAETELGQRPVKVASGKRATQNIPNSGQPWRAASITPRPATAPSIVPTIRSRPAERVASSAGCVTTMAVTKAQNRSGSPTKAASPQASAQAFMMRRICQTAFVSARSRSLDLRTRSSLAHPDPTRSADIAAAVQVERRTVDRPLGAAHRKGHQLRNFPRFGHGADRDVADRRR